MAAEKETRTSETAGASAARVNRDELRKVVHNFECANLSHGGIGVLLTAARELLARDEAHAREPICESGCGPAVTAGPEGVPLCQGCADNLRATASEARDEAKDVADIKARCFHSFNAHGICSRCGEYSRLVEKSSYPAKPRPDERREVYEAKRRNLVARLRDVADSLAVLEPAAPAPPVEPSADSHVLALDDYEAANLLWALTEIMNGSKVPAGWMNSGDWLGIRWKLEALKPTTKPNGYVGQPVEAAQRRLATDLWMQCAAEEIAAGFRIGNGPDEYVTDEQRADVASRYLGIIKHHYDRRNGIAGQGEREGGDTP